MVSQSTRYRIKRYDLFDELVMLILSIYRMERRQVATISLVDLKKNYRDLKNMIEMAKLTYRKGDDS